MEYNWSGTIDPSEFRFPYPDAAFDVVMAVSLFTHLLSDAAVRYATEIARVLKPGAMCLQTFFLLNPETDGLIKQGLGTYRFRHEDGVALVDDPVRPEGAVAYREQEVRSYFESVGLGLVEPILYGSWCGRESGRSFQDIVIARKTITSGPPDTYSS